MKDKKLLIKTHPFLNLKLDGIKNNYLITLNCNKCGNKSKWKNNTWEMNIIGMLQFKCKKCGSIYNAPDGLWK